MLSKFLLFFRRYTSTLSKKDLFSMNKVYFRMCDENQLNISFMYNCPDIGVNRQFNFARKLSENIDSLSRRISTNLDKIIMKKKKKKANKVSGDDMTPGSENPSKVLFLINNESIPGETICESFVKSTGSLTLQMNNFIYEVVINSPWIDTLSLPSSLLVGFPAYPSKFEAVFTDRQFSNFTWFSGKCTSKPDDILWEQKSQGYLYFPTTSDIGHRLKLVCIPGNCHARGPANEVISQTNVEAGPGFCPFETRQLFTSSCVNGKSLRVISYNILADLYCDSDFTRAELFPYCPPYALSIDYRKQLIIKELLGYNGDIICLQEVDIKVFDYDLKPVLSEKGFSGIFVKKGGLVAEGLACFYRDSKFELIDNHKIVLGEEISTLPLFSDIWEVINKNEALSARIIDRATAVQTTILRSIENPDEMLVVGNTHFYFHPDADHIRLLQGGLAIRWLREKLQSVSAANSNKRVSLIFCGDFNTVPSCGIYQLYTKGFVPDDHIDWKSNAEEAVAGLSLSQDLILDSACGTPQYTNFTVGFSDCLDYIFYTKDSLSIEQVVPFPSEEELRQYTALPSVVFPSDHIALIADLKFT